jgi:hypothetical protein
MSLGYSSELSLCENTVRSSTRLTTNGAVSLEA